MAIEKMLTDLTDAINRLAGAIESSGASAPPAPVAEPAPAPKAAKPKAAKPAPEPEVVEAEVVEPEQPAGEQPSREHVRERLMALKKSADATDLVGSMGVTRLSQVPDEQLAELLAKVEAKLEEQAGETDGGQGVLD